MQFAVIGDQGMLGSEMRSMLEALGQSVSGFNRSNLNLDWSPQEIAGVLTQSEVLINCVAYTKVDEAEQNWELANLVNGDYAGKLATAARLVGAKMIHISTDYVFPGTSKLPARPNDQVAPINAYGRSKALGEKLVMKSGADFQIFRTAWLYGSSGNCFPKAIARKLLKSEVAKVVGDQFGQPTWTKDLCEVIYDHTVNEYSEPIVHAVASGSTNWYGFAEAVARELPTSESYVVQNISSSELSLKTVRPQFSVLDNSESKGPIIGHWLDRWRTAASEVVSSIQ
jgi:dTDP-4-dehydrorhamnose reductase